MTKKEKEYAVAHIENIAVMIKKRRMTAYDMQSNLHGGLSYAETIINEYMDALNKRITIEELGK